MMIKDEPQEVIAVDDDDLKDFQPNCDDALFHDQDEFLSEFVEEVEPNLPPIPKLRIKISKEPNGKRKCFTLDNSEPYLSKAPKARFSCEIVDDTLIAKEESSHRPINNKTGAVKVRAPKVGDEVPKTVYPRPRYSVKTVRRQVEFNPDALLGTICYNSRKQYDQSGTTCHQCRQKTIDLKSRCYSPYCHGVRGQFCGYCLLQRYGEDVAVVLRDPEWKCPPCRRICNCSICRRSHGKPPTGQLFQLAKKHGFCNVKEYLAQLGDDKLDDSTPTDGAAEPGNTPPSLDEVLDDTDDWRPLNIKQEPVDYEYSDFEDVDIKQEPLDYDFEGEFDPVDYNYDEMVSEERPYNNLVEFESTQIKIEPPDVLES